MQEIYQRLQKESGLRIGIIDADLIDHGTRHPNLALLKISSYCKSQGHQVELMLDYSDIEEFDVVFLSCVFSFTKVNQAVLDMPNVYFGGTGLFPDGGEDLPSYVEHSRPDYALYDPYVERGLTLGRRRSVFSDYLDYSIGFTTRGCFRKCSFCVNKKYDRVHFHAHIDEFFDPSRPYIYLWDDNFLAFSHWRKVLDELQETGRPFQFRQGLDVRLMTDEKAKVLSRCRYHGDFIFAFDHVEDRELIEKKLLLWRTWTDKGTRLYVLSGYDSQDEKDIESVFLRIAVLMKYDCLPYIMRYESYKGSQWRALYVNIARWCNQPQFFKKKSFREFCEANQMYHKNKETMCSAYKAMKDFEDEFPAIASRYFDLRFEEESMLKRFGRPFFNRPSNEEMDRQRVGWMQFASGRLDGPAALTAYFGKQLDIVCGERLQEENVLGGGTLEELFSVLRRSSLNEILSSISGLEDVELITAANVPQYSKLESALMVPMVLDTLKESLEFEALGMYLNYVPEKKAVANRKYGENHAKLATLLDLADLSSRSGVMLVSRTPFGELFCGLKSGEKMAMAARLSFRIPVVQQVLRDAIKGEVYISDYLKPFSESTKKRRLPNIRALFDLIGSQSTPEDGRLREALGNIR